LISDGGREEDKMKVRKGKESEKRANPRVTLKEKNRMRIGDG